MYFLVISMLMIDRFKSVTCTIYHVLWIAGCVCLYRNNSFLLFSEVFFDPYTLMLY